MTKERRKGITRLEIPPNPNDMYVDVGLPKGAELLRVDVVGGKMWLWNLQSLPNVITRRRIWMLPDNLQIDSDLVLRHINSYIGEDPDVGEKSIIVHFFEDIGLPEEPVAFDTLHVYQEPE